MPKYEKMSDSFKRLLPIPEEAEQEELKTLHFSTENIKEELQMLGELLDEKFSQKNVKREFVRLRKMLEEVINLF